MSGEGGPDPANLFSEQTAALDASGAPAGAPRRIGPYAVIGELGHGGMGTVYLAARADGQFDKQVAIKLIRAAAISDDLLRRFQRETKILASLEHPGVARLLEGGTTEDGLPYIVMEFVDGVTLLEYCRTGQLSIPDRLRLFQAVCAAVQHAHRTLVIHRDIKPGNILVTKAGVPKLLDFGLAKALTPEAAADQATATALALTPAYASPEQVQGRLLTTATDIYSLGVVLYELLSGEPPYRARRDEPFALLRAVVEEDPRLPSTALTQSPPVEATRRMLRGDLDAIVMKALRKAPLERYASVEALSADIGRWLAGLPVTARVGTWTYRFGKFAVRHKIALAVCVVFAALVIGFTTTLAIESRRLAQQRDRASRERDRAARVSAFLIDLFKVSDPMRAPGTSATAREVLDAGAAKIANELQDEPETRAALLSTLGVVYRNLGAYDKAQPLLEQALAARRQLFGEEHLDVARSLNELGVVLAQRGESAQAEKLFREALLVRQRLAPSSPDVAESLNDLANIMDEKGDVDGAERMYREALAIRRAGGKESAEVADVLGNLATLQYERSQYAEAEKLFREVLALERRLVGADHPDIAVAMNNLAAVLQVEGHFDAAEALDRQTLALRRKTLGAAHPDVATSLYNLGVLLVDRGQYAEAEGLVREAWEMDSKLHGPTHPDVAARILLLASIRALRGFPVEAEALCREALAMRRKQLGDEHYLVGDALIVLAGSLHDQRRYDAAEATSRDALALYRRALPTASLETASALQTLAEVLIDEGKAPEAEPPIREALAIRNKNLPGDHPLVLEVESVLGGCFAALHRYAEAEPLLLRSLQGLQAARGADSRATRDARDRVVRYYEKTGRADKAAQYRKLSPASHTR
jgi:serine/threonine-protein kinase